MRRIVALLSEQGTACTETALYEDEDTPDNRKQIEDQFCTDDGYGYAPIRGTWTDVSDNEAFWNCEDES